MNMTVLALSLSIAFEVVPNIEKFHCMLKSDFLITLSSMET